MNTDLERQDRAQETESELLAAVNPYPQISRAQINNEESKIIRAAIDEADVLVRPNDGVLYMGQGWHRDKLTEALGPGNWSLMPARPGGDHIAYEDDAKRVFWAGRLYIKGAFVSESIGEHEWRPENIKTSRVTAAEAAKSDVLKRCCKDLGMASELWRARWIADFTREYVSSVKVRQLFGQKKLVDIWISELFGIPAGYSLIETPGRLPKLDLNSIDFPEDVWTWFSKQEFREDRITEVLKKNVTYQATVDWEKVREKQLDWATKKKQVADAAEAAQALKKDVVKTFVAKKVEERKSQTKTEKPQQKEIEKGTLF